MLTQWQNASLEGIRRYCARHGTRMFSRKALIREELPRIIQDSGASGATPEQTLSRVLQELRRTDLIIHVDRGVDLLLDTPLLVEEEDLPDVALDAAIQNGKLRISDVDTSDGRVIARRRRGQARLRQNTLANYGSRCALCDVCEEELLVTSHIARWADVPEAQGRLSNVICLCKMHDSLFEAGYITFTDDLQVIRSKEVAAKAIRYLQDTSEVLRLPSSHPPSPEYLRQHRIRIGYESQ